MVVVYEDGGKQAKIGRRQKEARFSFLAAQTHTSTAAVLGRDETRRRGGRDVVDRVDEGVTLDRKLYYTTGCGQRAADRGLIVCSERLVARGWWLVDL